MTKTLKVLSAAVLGLCAIHFHATYAKDNSSTPDNGNLNQTVEFLRVAWILKPPYTRSRSIMNGSLNREADLRGLIQDALLRYIIVECGLLSSPSITYDVKSLEADSEFEMIELLRNNEVDFVAPIFETPDIRRYSEFHFLKLIDYPGTDFITTEDETHALDVVLDAVLKSWPLLAVTLIETAIAGIIVWALDTYWNSEEFPRSFIKGSWHGFWWSFISMTTVGYGDKAPKSIAARIFSVTWILGGVITMAVFTANITSALTALSLDQEPSSFVDVKVAVLGNGTEYHHALEEGAHPKVYNTIDEIIQALKTKEVDGMMLDRYTASYYQTRGKLESLLTVKKLELQRDVGVLFSKNRNDLTECLDVFRSNISRLVQTLTATIKLTQQKRTKNVSLFDHSSPFMKMVMYTSLGILLTMIFVGTLYDLLMRRNWARCKQDARISEEVNDRGTTAKRQTILNDLKVARGLLLQMQEHFNELEAEVSKLSLNDHFNYQPR